MHLLKIVETIERHRQFHNVGYTNWFIEQIAAPDQWKETYPRRAHSPSFLSVCADSEADAEAVVHHFSSLGMRAPQRDGERHGQHLHLHYMHPRWGLGPYHASLPARVRSSVGV
jgi:hypothetical protein